MLYTHDDMIILTKSVTHKSILTGLCYGQWRHQGRNMYTYFTEPSCWLLFSNIPQK